MTISENILSIIRLTSFFGLAPFRSEEQWLNTKIIILLFIIQFIYICILSIPCIYQCTETILLTVNDAEIEVSELESLLEVSFLSITVLIAWSFSLICHKDLLLTVSKFLEVENYLSLLGINKLSKREETIKTVQLISLALIILIHYILEYIENGHNWGYLFTLTIALIFLYQYVNLILCVNYCFINLNKYLCLQSNDKSEDNLGFKIAHMENNTKYFGLYSKWKRLYYFPRRLKIHPIVKNNKSEFIETNNIVIAREIHRQLFELCNEINNYFAWQILVYIMSKIILITFVLYYLLSSSKLDEFTFDNLIQWIPRLNKAILCISNFLQLVLIAYICTSTAEEVSIT